MTAPTDAVDCGAAERRSRWLRWLTVPAAGLLALAYGVAGDWDDVLRWAVVALALVAAVSVLLVNRGPQRRAKAAEARRIQHAVLRSVDPGPELRRRADRQAQVFARTPWLGVTFPLLTGRLVLQADWEHPVSTGIAVALVIATFLALGVWWTRQSRAARRWLAAPPGPARSIAPDPSARTWRWLGIAAVGCLALGLVLGVVAALVD